VLSVAIYLLVCWMLLCWVSLGWMSLCWVSWHQFWLICWCFVIKLSLKATTIHFWSN